MGFTKEPDCTNQTDCWNESLKGWNCYDGVCKALYMIGAPDTDKCPDGYERVIDANECAVQASKLVYFEFKKTGCWDMGEMKEDGCFFESPRSLYYNNCS